jgi:hypothetical protein
MNPRLHNRVTHGLTGTKDLWVENTIVKKIPRKPSVQSRFMKKYPPTYLRNIRHHAVTRYSLGSHEKSELSRRACRENKHTLLSRMVLPQVGSIWMRLPYVICRISARVFAIDHSGAAVCAGLEVWVGRARHAVMMSEMRTTTINSLKSEWLSMGIKCQSYPSRK